jgi:hypothetical protein
VSVSSLSPTVYLAESVVVSDTAMLVIMHNTISSSDLIYQSCLLQYVQEATLNFVRHMRTVRFARMARGT